MQTDKKYLLVGILLSALFTAIILVVGQNYNHATFLPDQGALWYYWKLPVVTDLPRLTGWVLFISQLLITWYLAYKVNNSGPITNKLNKYNYAMLVSVAVFAVLHLIQTYFFYDSLAHDTPVWLSQISVIIMLVLMMILLNDKRGLFFGKRIPISRNIVEFVRKWHGMYIILAIVFTYWYHPMEPSLGHLIGFFYMFLLLIQVALANTTMHFNKYWVFALEFIVLIHGTAVAIMTGNGMWPMFASGFGFVTIVTYIYLLKLKKNWTLIFQLIYIVCVIIVYTGGLGSNRTPAKLYEIVQIPIVEYVLVFVFAGIIGIGYKLKGIGNKNEHSIK